MLENKASDAKDKIGLALRLRVNDVFDLILRTFVWAFEGRKYVKRFIVAREHKYAYVHFNTLSRKDEVKISCAIERWFKVKKVGSIWSGVVHLLTTLSFCDMLTRI